MYAIIDNSTLTAVQRLMGEIVIKNMNTIDGDILALESFVQAVLFYDDIFFIDDYKAQHKASREKYFKYIYPIEFSPESYDAIVKETQKLTNDFIPRVRNRTFDNDTLKEFFGLLKMNMTFTWDLRSSVYYLTHKLLQTHCGVDIPKYSKLSEMIFSQFYNGEPIDYMKKKEPLIYDSKGNIITSDYTLYNKWGSAEESYISKQTQLFMAGLSWMDFRTTFYTLVAKQLGFDLILHPIRNTYEISILKQYSTDQQTSRALMNSIKRISNDAFNNIVSATQPILLNAELPMLSVWVAQKMGNMNNFIDTVYTLKGEKEFIKAREILNDLDSIHKEKGNKKYITESNLLICDFKQQMNKLQERYGVLQSSMDITSSLIKVYNLSAVVNQMPTMPILNFKVNKPNLIKKLYHYSGFGATYKAIISDLSSIEKLGRYHDILTSRVVLDRDVRAYNLKVEDSKFANYQSYWKIPL